MGDIVYRSSLAHKTPVHTPKKKPEPKIKNKPEEENIISKPQIAYPKKEIVFKEASVILETEDKLADNSDRVLTKKEEVESKETKEKLVKLWQETRLFKKEVNKKTREISRNKVYIIAGFVVCITIFTLVSTIFSRLTIDFKPRAESMSLQNITVSFDTSVSQILIPQKVIPAERLEFTKKLKQEYPTTGKQYVEAKAKGRVRVYNSYSSSPQKLVIFTRFTSDSGVLFRLTSTIIVPGAKIQEGKIIPQYIEADLVADQAGDNSNVDGQINLKIPGFKDTPKYTTFYATAISGFSGGFKGESRVISKDDLQKAQADVTKNIYDAIQNEMLQKIPKDFKFIDGLKEVAITKVISPDVGSPVDNFAVEAEAQGRVLMFREQDVVALVQKLILQGDDTKKYVDGSADLTYQVQNVDFDKGKTAIAIGGNITAQTLVSEKDLAEAIKGQKTRDINNILKNRSEIADFRASFFPPWISGAPNDTTKIRFKNTSN